jgi:hypothetical protein
MMGDRALTKHQFGIETVHGTAVAADTMLLAETSPLTPDRMPERVEENTGLRAAGYRIRDGDVVAVTDSLNLPHAYYQALPALLSCGLKGGVTPAEQTSGQGDYLWTFTPSMTGDNTPDSMTLEVGDDVDAYEREHLMFEGYRIQGSVNQGRGSAPVVVEGQYFARQNTKTSFTGGLSLPSSPQNLSAKLARLYRNAAWADLGNTEITNLLRSFDIQIMTGLHPKFFGSANRYFDSFGQDRIGFVASFTFEGNAAADDIYDLMQAGTTSFLRLAVNGAQIGTGDPHSLVIDMAGFWHDVIPLSAEDRGNNIHAAILTDLYDPTGAQNLTVKVTTNVSAI